MTPIKVSFPQLSSDQLCTPTNTLNLYYCFYNNYNGSYHNRNTYILTGYKLLRTRSETNQYGYETYNADSLDYLEVMPELTEFWFPFFSIICVGLIFFFVYRLMFRRFIK